MNVLSLIQVVVGFSLMILSLYSLVARVETVKKNRINNMDDSADFDDWERGSHERTIPEDAKPTKF